MSVFDKALAFTLKWEGGYSNNPNDPGGATMKGVIQKTYDDYRKSKGLPLQGVKAISDSEVLRRKTASAWRSIEPNAR